MPTRSKSLVAAAAVLLLLAVGWSFWSVFEPPPGPAQECAAKATEPAAAPAAADLGTPAPVRADDAAATREAAAPTTRPAPAAAAAPELRGRVLDAAGRPFANVPIGLAPFDWGDRRLRFLADAALVRSDGRGEFVLPGAPTTMAPAAGSGFCTLRTTPAEPGASTPLLVVVARVAPVTGVVTRPGGNPVPGARVAPATMFLLDFPLPLEHTVVPDVEDATTDEGGHYLLREVPLAAGLELLFTRQGFVTHRVPTWKITGPRLDVVLEPESGRADRLHGRVLDVRGPVVGAKLELGHEQVAVSDARGEFEFEVPKSPARLLAAARGYQPVVREGVGAGAGELVIEFSARALRIEGTVSFADGKPAVGWRLDLLDPLRGGRWDAVESFCSDVRERPPQGALARTDASGHFAVGGLSERTYRLLAYDPKTTLAVKSEPIAAGTTNAVLTVPADAVLGELRGQVVDRRGAPVAAAGLLCYLAPASAEGIVDGPSAQTGPDGRFLLKNVPRCHVQLGVSGEDVEYVVRPIEEWLQERDLRIVVTRSCHVQIEGEAGLVVTFLDADGKRLHVTAQTQGLSVGGNGWTLRSGKSPVLTVAETAATMVWSRDGKELGRKPVILDAANRAVTVLVATP